MEPAPRIAVLGFDLEANRFAPPSERWAFEEKAFYRGDAISEAARAAEPSIHGCLVGFYAEMDRACPGWQPMPVLFTGATPGGPVDQAFFDGFLEEVRSGLVNAGALDGVYICEHGAGVATISEDPDGDLFSLVRGVVGPDVPIVATLDLHANVSDRMVEATDLLVAYRTNPHVDQRERGIEAAGHLAEMIGGLRPVTAFVRLPLVPPSVALLTAEGQPYGDLIRDGQASMDEAILNVSVTAGFAFSDVPKNGMAVIVAAREDEAAARRLADALAARAWRERARYRAALTPLDDAVAGAVARGRDGGAEPRLLADVADNPGGGGGGNTMFLLRALVEAGADRVALGVVHDPQVVADAWAAGEGGRIEARFNRGAAVWPAEAYAAPAEVVRLSEGSFVGRHGGMVAGRTVRLGRACLLRVGGVSTIVISHRQQCLSSNYFEHFGLDLAGMATVVVKSRGHFRAGFEHLFPARRVDEVDAPGLTSPNLATFPWRGLPRPVYPLDPETGWSPERGEPE